jgi:hypothetical protein
MYRDDVKRKTSEADEVNHESEDSCRMKKTQDLAIDLALYQAFQARHRARQHTGRCLHRRASTL